MRKFQTISCFVVLILGLHQVAVAQSVSINKISPPSPAQLTFGNKVTLNFEYSIPNMDGARIFILPFTEGNSTPNYAVSGSRVYSGQGEGSAYFTIQSGQVTVDHVRIRVVRPDQDRLIFEFFMPVEFTFSSAGPGLALSNLRNNIPAKTPDTLTKPLNIQPFETASDTSDGEPELEQRVIRPDGSIMMQYSDGYRRHIVPGAGNYVVTPKGDTLTDTLSTMQPLMGVMPADPPKFISGGNNQASEEWIKNLNLWINYVSSQMKARIAILLTEDELQSYNNNIESEASNIYERMMIRSRFLDELFK